MSLELKIEALTVAVNALTAAMQIKTGVGALPVPTVAGVTAAAVTAPAAVPTFTMPAPPVLAVVPPPAPVAPAGVPFSDGKTLLAYVMESYKTLGPAKGARIQEVLISLGVGNINDVQPAQYSALHAAVEALKAA